VFSRHSASSAKPSQSFWSLVVVTIEVIRPQEILTDVEIAERGLRQAILENARDMVPTAMHLTGRSRHFPIMVPQHRSMRAGSIVESSGIPRSKAGN
jgi:hypothetical protein